MNTWNKDDFYKPLGEFDDRFDDLPGRFHRFWVHPYIDGGELTGKIPSLSLSQFYTIAKSLVRSGRANIPKKHIPGYDIPTVIGTIRFGRHDYASNVPRNRWKLKKEMIDINNIDLYDLACIHKERDRYKDSDDPVETFMAYTMVNHHSLMKHELLAHLAVLDILAKVMIAKVRCDIYGRYSINCDTYFLLIRELERAICGYSSFDDEEKLETVGSAYVSDLESLPLALPLLEDGAAGCLEEYMEDADKLKSELVTDLFGEYRKIDISDPYTCIALAIAREALNFPDIPYRDYKKAIGENEKVYALVTHLAELSTTLGSFAEPDTRFSTAFELVNAIVNAVEEGWCEALKNMTTYKPEKKVESKPNPFHWDDDKDEDDIDVYDEDDEEEVDDEVEEDEEVEHNFARPDGTEFEGGLDE